MSRTDLIQEQARKILHQDPDPVVRYRLLRDVLWVPRDSPELEQAGRKLLLSRWVRELESEQCSDGSWGRLHSRDASAKQRIPTTEAGVARALALGLDADHALLRRASRYLRSILTGEIEPRDRPEKNDRWSTGVRLFAAATLAQIQPDQPVLDEVWELWSHIARRTLESGHYDPEAESQAHRELTGASVKDSYLVLNNRYTLTLLGSRPGALPHEIESALLNWVKHRPGGISYLGVSLLPPPQAVHVGRFDRWLSSLELLSCFRSWPSLAQELTEWLWAQRDADGCWDLGPRRTASIALPLSESWRKKCARSYDWTTRTLILLTKHYGASDT